MIEKLPSEIKEVRALEEFYYSSDNGDYSMAFQRALNSDARVIDGGGYAYNISKSYIVKRGNLRLQNMTLNVQSANDKSTLIRFEGSETKPVGVSDSTLFSLTIDNVSDYVADDYIYVSSNQEWSQRVNMGELTQIESIDYENNTIYLRYALIANYNTENNAEVCKVNTLSNIVIDNVIINGLTDNSLNNNGIWFRKCLNVMVSNTYTNDFDARHIVIDRCIGTRVNGGATARTGNNDGLDYGVAIVNASLDTVIDSLSGTGLRHLVSLGGYDGVNKHSTIKHCRAFNTIDAAYDSHSASADVEFLFNHSDQSGGNETQQDGIVVQCASAKLIGNTLNNPRRHGILFTPEINKDVYLGKVGCESSLNRINTVNSPTNTAYGINVTTDSCSAGIDFFTSIGDVLGGQSGAYFVRANKSDICSLTIQSSKAIKPNTLRGVHLVANRHNINNITLNNNHIDISSKYECIYLQSIGEGQFNDVQITNNNINGGGTSIGIRLLNGHNIIETHNIIKNCSFALHNDNRCSGLYSLTPKVGKKKWDGATIYPGEQEIIIVTVDSVNYLDIVEATINVKKQGCIMTAYVSGTNTVTVTVSNNTDVEKKIEPCTVTVVTKRIL